MDGIVKSLTRKKFNRLFNRLMTDMRFGMAVSDFSLALALQGKNYFTQQAISEVVAG
ncbi:MAG: hypothetical protein IV108_04970 [Burkholderiales bacterium]|nr:hypothetical protein [Burkholderiales bacterium]